MLIMRVFRIHLFLFYALYPHLSMPFTNYEAIHDIW